jgi:hypothetical protein
MRFLTSSLIGSLSFAIRSSNRSTISRRPVQEAMSNAFVTKVAIQIAVDSLEGQRSLVS